MLPVLLTLLSSLSFAGNCNSTKAKEAARASARESLVFAIHERPTCGIKSVRVYGTGQTSDSYRYKVKFTKSCLLKTTQCQYEALIDKEYCSVDQPFVKCND